MYIAFIGIGLLLMTHVSVVFRIVLLRCHSLQLATDSNDVRITFLVISLTLDDGNES